MLGAFLKNCTAIILAAVGFKVFYPFLRVIFLFTIGQRYLSKRDKLQKCGGWAIITGGGDGIGKAFAYELAKDGFNIFILGRTEEKLKLVASALETVYRVQTKCLAVDFTRNDIYERIQEEVQKLSHIGCLVNNVGMTNQHWEEFGREPTLTIGQIQRMIACNISSMACMTRLVLPSLLSQKSSSAIINISSSAGELPLPYHAFYASTKCFAIQFSNCLEAELETTPIMVQCYCPMYVRTNLTDTEQGLTVPDPRSYVRSALEMFGVERNTTGYFWHSMQRASYTLAPRPLMTSSIRQDYMKNHKKY